jgi:mono/diheme cytochrome c family protein
VTALLALTTTNIAILIVILMVGGWILYALFNMRAGHDEIGSEIELAPNRKPYYDDETLEGPRLDRTLMLGVLFLLVIAVALPVYWVLEPTRQANATSGSEVRFASRGAALFAPTADGGFNCAGCHGGMKATGGSAPYTLIDPKTGQAKAVTWNAPALNTVLYRFDESEVNFIITYGRPFSPMSPWGLDGGGPMNEQQISNIISYIRSIQIPRENCDVADASPLDCEGGTLPAEKQQEIEAAARQSVADGTYGSYGQALFNLSLDSGAYSCARCHTTGWSWGDPGVSGNGAFGWNLTGASTAAHFPNESDMIDFIKSGSEYGKRYAQQGQGTGRMPAFGNLLTDDQIKAIAEYVRSL